jgi:hypothetical protein
MAASAIHLVFLAAAPYNTVQTDDVSDVHNASIIRATASEMSVNLYQTT